MLLHAWCKNAYTKNVINFANQINMKPRVAIYQEQRIQLTVCRVQLKQKNLWKGTKENINAYVHGPLAFDNAVSLMLPQLKTFQVKLQGKQIFYSYLI